MIKLLDLFTTVYNPISIYILASATLLGGRNLIMMFPLHHCFECILTVSWYEDVKYGCEMEGLSMIWPILWYESERMKLNNDTQYTANIRHGQKQNSFELHWCFWRQDFDWLVLCNISWREKRGSHGSWSCKVPMLWDWDYQSMMWMVVTVVRNKHHFISLLRPAVRQPQQRLESIRENETEIRWSHRETFLQLLEILKVMWGKMTIM